MAVRSRRTDRRSTLSPGSSRRQCVRRGTRRMKFGVFDHMDDAGVAVHAALRRPRAAGGGLRPRRLLRLPPRRAPRDAARLRRLAGAVPGRDRAAHDAAALRPAGLSPALLPPGPPDRGNLHARSDERRAVRARHRPRRVAARSGRLRRRLQGGAGDLSRGAATSSCKACRPTSSPSRASTTASARCRWCCGRCSARIRRCGAACCRSRARTGRRRTTSTSSRSGRAQMVRAIVDRYRAAARKARQGRRPAHRRRPPRGGGRHRRRGACGRAPRLSALGRELPLAVGPARDAARHHRLVSRQLRRAAGARPRHRRLAAHGARLHRRRHRGDRRQLFPVLVRVRRSHAGGIAALGRAVRARGHAGVRAAARGAAPDGLILSMSAESSCSG